jgi:hypothetical protein
MIRRFAWTSVAALLLASTPPAAHAQMKFDSIGGNKASPGPPKVAPPPALPGAASNDANPAPTARAPADMEPNDALFDAINRGDIATARDALSRGADMNARNILGMTPMELSVDLGRNDISFLLLSMRETGGRQAPSAASALAAKQPPARQAKQAQAKRAPVAKAAAVPQPAPSQSPRLFAGDGGAPNPNAGFLGFDTTRR